MKSKMSFYLDTDLYERIREASFASRITKQPFRINEIIEEILTNNLDEWLSQHENIKLIIENRRLFI